MNKLFKPLIDRTIEVFVDNMMVKSMIDAEHGQDLRKTFDILQAFRMKFNPKKYVFGVISGKFLGFMLSS